MDLRFSLAGLLVGVLIGLTGMGGGSLLAPILIFFFGVPPVWAVSTDLAYSTVTKAVGSIIHIREKHVDFKIAFWLAIGSVPATFLSVLLVLYIRHVNEKSLNNLIAPTLGCVLILVAAVLLIKPYLMRVIARKRAEQEKQNLVVLEAAEGQANAQADDKNNSSWDRIYRPLITASIGAVVGVIVGFTSIGSGTLIVVSIFALYPQLTTKKLVGTDVFQGFMLVTAGATAYLIGGSIQWLMVGSLLIGSLPGVIIGSYLSKYIPDQFMRPVVAVVLAISGFKLI